MADPLLKDHFKGVNMELHDEKLRYYIGVLGGGYPMWIGQSLKHSHCKYKINDAKFDGFVSHCVQALKDMRVK